MCHLNQFIFYGILLFIHNVVCDMENTINDCVDRKHSTKIELPLDVVNDKGELELWILFNGKYDLYQTYNNGHIYHSELELKSKVSPRSGSDRADCSNYLQAVPSWYGCPYTITEDENRVNITLESFLQNVIYSVGKTTKEMKKYTRNLYGSSDTEQIQLDCVKEVSKYSIPLPIEINRKENHLEITVKYRGKYDFYNTIALGTICGIQYQLDEKPNPTLQEYSHCSKCRRSAELYAWCPFKIIEDDKHVTITLEAFFYKNIYKINKKSRDIRYKKTLIGKDPVIEFEEQINACHKGLSATNTTLPIQIIRNNDFLEIWIKRNNKYDIFETYVSGSVCKTGFQSSRDPNVLIPRHPAECFSPGLDVPYYFICPYDILEDEDFVFFKIHANDQHLYAVRKVTDELLYRTFPTYYDSDHQDTVSYLRTVVLSKDDSTKYLEVN